MDSRLHGCMAALCGCLALLTSVATAVANERPDAGFGFFPSNPVAGQTVQFVSYACDPDGAVFDEEWDLDGDGAFDGFGAHTVHSFPADFNQVALRVTPLEGRPVIRTVSIGVGTGPPLNEIFTPPLLNPFPVVRIVGQLAGGGARIDFLSVRAPVCSRVTTISLKGPAARSRGTPGSWAGTARACGRWRDARCGPASDSRCSSRSGTGSGSTRASRSGAGSHRSVWTAVSGSARRGRATARDPSKRNLRGPLAGLQSELRIGVRTGDTPAKERAEMLRHPPDILITTPESLYLVLTSRARRT